MSKKSVAAAVFLVLFAACTAAVVSDGKIPEVSTAVIEKRPIEECIRLSGELVPEHTEQIICSSDGVLKKMYFKVGDEVGAGNLFASLESRSLPAQAAIDDNGFSQALRAAQTYGFDMGSWYSAVAGGNKAIETQASAVQSGVLCQSGGEVLSVEAAEGQTMGAGQVIGTVADMESFIITAAVSEADYMLLKPDMKVRFSACGMSGEGKVRSLSTELKTDGLTGEKTGIVYIEPEVREGYILGASAKLDIVIKSAAEAVCVPLEALSGEDEVFVIEGGVALKKELALGLMSDEYAQVISGLEPGDEVAVELAKELRTGDAVR